MSSEFAQKRMVDEAAPPPPEVLEVPCCPPANAKTALNTNSTYTKLTNRFIIKTPSKQNIHDIKKYLNNPDKQF
jgi:hypothetical protein